MRELARELAEAHNEAYRLAERLRRLAGRVQSVEDALHIALKGDQETLDHVYKEGK